MKGIILAGGKGSRLYPSTIGTSKQLLPVYNKPMIYYPLSVLMLLGIRDVLIIVNPHEKNAFQRLLGNGEKFGINIEFEEQVEAKGIADAFLIGEKFIGDSDVFLILGDNIFYGDKLADEIKTGISDAKDASIFAYHVANPSQFGVVTFNDDGSIISIDEKPARPNSNFAITGLYYYRKSVVRYAKTILPSTRGELEISSINNKYLANDNLHVSLLGRGVAWLDTGTPKALLDASQFVYTIENRQGLKIACLEEIALNRGWITEEHLEASILKMGSNEYREYLEHLVQQSP